MTAKFEKNLVWIILLFIVVLGTALRFTNLSNPSIWIDELNHYYSAEGLLENGEPTLPSGFKYSRALLYSKLVSYSFQLFGANEFSLRLPSALLGVLCIIVALFIAKRFFGSTCAVLTALFVAISPFAIGWSRLSRMYTLFQLLFMLGVYAFYRGFESDNQGWFHRWQDKILAVIKAPAITRHLNSWQINIFWLVLAATLFVISYSVHNITALFFVGFLFYLGFMFLVQWRRNGFLESIKGKYFVVLSASVAFTTSALLISPQLRSFVTHTVNYIPPWAVGTRFQDRKLYLDFIFDHYNFPMGTLFVIGAYQILSRLHRSGIYVLSIFLAYVFMFTFVFSYRHFQYIYNVYALFIIISAYAFSNIVANEFDTIKRNWFAKTKLSNAFLKGLVLSCFLVWLPLTPSVRLTRRIPMSEDGGFNGAMYMEEWREACSFVKERISPNDLVISTDALGTFHYLRKIDFDLNFADFDQSIERNLKDSKGEYFDLYSGSPFIKNLEHLKQLINKYETVWILVQHYKFLEAEVFVPLPIRDYVSANFEQVLTTKNGTVLVFYYSKESKASFQANIIKELSTW